MNRIHWILINEENARYLVDVEEKKTGVLLDMEAYNSLMEFIDDCYCLKEYDRVEAANDAEIAQGYFVIPDQLKTKFRRQHKTLC